MICGHFRYRSTTADSSRGEFADLALLAHSSDLRILLFGMRYDGFHFFLQLGDRGLLLLNLAILFLHFSLLFSIGWISSLNRREEVAVPSLPSELTKTAAPPEEVVPKMLPI